MDELIEQVAAAWRKLREERPLILCITNRVTPQRVADTLLAAGASPVMADNPDEVPQMAAISSAIYLNTGLHETQPASLEAAGRTIGELAKPSVLDPVGAGATEYRSSHIQRLLAGVTFSAVRGNASEIHALAGTGAGARGVDSSDSADSAHDAAVSLAGSLGAVVAVSGERDLITDGERVVRVGGGHPWLAQITGSGCALGALTTACIATSDPWIGAIAAHTAFALATDRAVARSRGPGTLSVHLLDEIAALDPMDFSEADLNLQRASQSVPGVSV